MIATLIRWQELTRVWIGHWLSRPFHHLFNLMPGVEVGLSTSAITRLPIIHAALAGRRAVHLSDLHWTVTAQDIVPSFAAWPN